MNRALPDGFADLAAHNLITFKSFQDTFDAWAVKELIGHYVNYRKQKSPAGTLMPESEFRLFGISSRYPQKLASELAAVGQPLAEVSPGVYDIFWGTDRIRLLVINRLPTSEANMMLHLFASDEKRVRIAQEWYTPERFEEDFGEVNTLLHRLFDRYHAEGKFMAITLDKFLKDERAKLVASLTPEERLGGMTAEDRLRGMTAEDRLRDMTTEDRLHGMTTEDRLHGLQFEDRIRDLAPDEVQKMREFLNHLESK